MSKPLNFMFLQFEDTGRHFGCYGDAYAKTPNVDRLASEGTVYTQAFSHSPVCAPSRGGMVSGQYPWSLGNQYMRCQLTNPPRCFTHELVDAGVHVSWPTKTDFNFDPSPGWCTDTDAWWEKPAPAEPFFLYENLVQTHESRMFGELPPFHEDAGGTLPTEGWHDPEDAPIPPYFPDTPELRWQLARYYDAVSETDRKVGERLKWLEDQGLQDNTVVILLSDHGRGLPREKRWCYDAGLHLPLIIRWPGHLKPGSVNSELTAWVDIAPTILSLAGVDIPDPYQGQVFLGNNRGSERETVFSGRDRMDDVYDWIRVARNHQFHYIRNYAPGLPYALKQEYMEQQPVMPVMRRMAKEGALAGNEAVFFQDSKPHEELYDNEADPDHLHNLAADPAYGVALQELRDQLDRHLAEVGDRSEKDEKHWVREGLIHDQFPQGSGYSCPTPLLPEDFYPQPQPHPRMKDEATAYLCEPE